MEPSLSHSPCTKAALYRAPLATGALVREHRAGPPQHDQLEARQRLPQQQARSRCRRQTPHQANTVPLLLGPRDSRDDDNDGGLRRVCLAPGTAARAVNTLLPVLRTQGVGSVPIVQTRKRELELGHLFTGTQLGGRQSGLLKAKLLYNLRPLSSAGSVLHSDFYCLFINFAKNL